MKNGGKELFFLINILIPIILYVHMKTSCLFVFFMRPINTCLSLFFFIFVGFFTS